ncbi:uncharacterized protein LOC118262333 [Spodoptera frugiperda]|uniref:Uncharacterized protein LOC118262333 n=1 Tax=Spodoptera frugiperda TaxID=7108 RepID=A0A9R0CUA2_SPOFR|nr:uncharacterized protein LOC118262333 [Spodoptera frugiperda]
MKKVRFESPAKAFLSIDMNERECHSPRPLVERQIHANVPDVYSQVKVLPYSNDPVQLFECSNSSPYPTMTKTPLPGYQKSPEWSPSHDLDLSMLDASYHEPRRPTFSRSILKPTNVNHNAVDDRDSIKYTPESSSAPKISSENKTLKLPNIMIKDDGFFIKRDNLDKFNLDMNPLTKQLNMLSLDKENDPFTRKSEMVQMAAINMQDNVKSQPQPTRFDDSDCRCHHCVKKTTPINSNYIMTNEQMPQHHRPNHASPFIVQNAMRHNHCPCILPPQPSRCSCCTPTPPARKCQCSPCGTDKTPSPKLNAVDKKTWAIERYEQSKNSDSMEVEKQTNVSKEKREPTVSDLFKIIKLQNEQLQLLQEKVDKFITASQQTQIPAQKHVAIETVGNEQHKISIGVMTSFEMVRTSTVINKEILKTNDNAQIQCNRSQISIKEVVSKGQTPNPNFLDGITPVGETMRAEFEAQGNVLTNTPMNGSVLPLAGVNEEKTLNELSLCNVQVDNATTPLMSPEQSLYLDVRDYSDSDADSDNQSNVGWTYYNKVMTHVNGMLQDSDMPSSASALYRNTRQQLQTVQMHIDKTNVSVTKRVKFGDDPLGLHQPHIYASTDTSLKMNQLAAKYLKNGAPVAVPQRLTQRPATAPVDMSFATRNYMERHKLLQGIPPPSKSASPGEMPRFLDITALKQQPKFL